MTLSGVQSTNSEAVCMYYCVQNLHTYQQKMDLLYKIFSTWRCTPEAEIIYI